MPESTTSSQASTPTPYELNGGAEEGHWDQVSTTNSENVMQAVMPLDWNELPPQCIAPVPVSSNNVSSEYITSSASHINVLSNQVVYSPPNFINAPYQRPTVSHGYTTLNPARGMHSHVLNGHVMRPQNGHVIRPQNGPVVPGPTWPNQTAPGRFVAQTPGWNNTKPSGGVKKQKRIRTAFTSQQMMELEQEYSRTRYLDRARRIELADILRLNERTIKIWFQNRRMKEKKDRAESLEDSEEASTTVSSPEMGTIQMPMLIHEQYPGMKTDAYNQGNIYLEHYPAMSTPISMPVASLTTSMPGGQIPPQNMYVNYMEEGCQPQYQEVHLQVQPYPSPFSEVPESSSETATKMETAPSDVPSDIIEKSWDLSWIRSVPYEEEY